MYGIVWVCDPQLRPLRPGASLAGTFARQTGRVFVGPSLPECPWAPCIFLYEHVQSTMPCARRVYTHTHLYAKKLLHTEAFTQRSLSHRWALHRALPQTSSAPLQNRILPQFLTFDPHFVRKACIWTCKTPILHFTPISAFGPHLVRKGDSTPRQTKFSISPHVCAPDTHHLRKRLRFVSKHLAAPAAKRENLEELEK